MSDLRTAAQQVVDEHEAGFVGLSLDKAVAALKAALAEPPAYTNREVMQMALESLEQSETFVPYEGFGMVRREAERKHQAAITALKAALAEPQAEPAPGLHHGWVLREVLFDNGEPISHREPQSKQTLDGPLGQMHFYHSSQSKPEEMVRWDGSAPLVMTPRPEFQRSTQRQPLTEEQIIALRKSTKATDFSAWSDSIAFARAIERAHGITGEAK